MKKNFIAVAILGLIGIMMPPQMDAQGLGDLLKKGKKVLEAVSNNSSNTETQNEPKGVKASTQTFENGIEMINPIAEYIDVTPIGLYGIPTSENYGDAYLVLKVMMKEPKNTASFGGSVNNEKMIAVDANGKVYNTYSNGTNSFDTPEGIPVQIVIDSPSLMFKGIKKSFNVMPMVKFGIFIDAYHKGNLTLKNVPILWQEPTEEAEE